jgi:hypothetical protein
MRKGLRLKWVSAYKFGADGQIIKFKQRLVAAAWNKTKGIEYEESYIGSRPISDLRVLECVAIEKGFKRLEMDHRFSRNATAAFWRTRDWCLAKWHAFIYRGRARTRC